MADNGKRLGFLPNWRIFTYVILVINALFLIWIIAGASSSNDTSKKNCGSLSAKTCNDAQNVGKGIGVTIIIVLWVLLDIILLVLWLITNRKKTRDCPACGSDVKKGQFQCKRCGYDFRSALAPQGAYPQQGQAPPYYQQQPYPQQQPQQSYQASHQQPETQHQPPPPATSSSSYYTPPRSERTPAPQPPQPARRPGPRPNSSA